MPDASVRRIGPLACGTELCRRQIGVVTCEARSFLLFGAEGKQEQSNDDHKSCHEGRECGGCEIRERETLHDEEGG